MKEYMIIQGLKIEVERIPYEAVKPVPPRPIVTLVCCCCGQLTEGRQWWNRDTGFGHCNACTERYDKDTKDGEKNDCFGFKGEHYYIKS